MVEIFRRVHGEVPVVEMPAGSIPFGEAHIPAPGVDEMLWSMLVRECEMDSLAAQRANLPPGAPWRFSDGSRIRNPDAPAAPRKD